jgi:hypothetical protein
MSRHRNAQTLTERRRGERRGVAGTGAPGDVVGCMQARRLGRDVETVRERRHRH